MCQILVLTRTLEIKNQDRVTRVIAAHLQATQQDGFGYAVLGKEGTYGERTTRDTFTSRLGKESLKVPSSIIELTWNSFGKPSQAFGAGIYHGRTSTNHKSITNTHPINKNGWSLIHNGVVTNVGPDYKKETTNDTEDIAHYLSTAGISSIEKYISGYYAVAAIDPKGNLHLFKDSMAKLFVAYNKTLNCYIFGTTEKLITEVSKELKWKIGPTEVVKDNIYLVYSPKGELMNISTIKPLGYSRRESELSEKSLGYKVYDSRESFGYYNDDFPYTEDSLEAYNEEIECMDASYTVKDWLNRPMTLEDFRKLDEVTKRDCKVIRGDGTLVDPEDYYTEKLA
jgi:predicted glutamine amidotransferase